MLELLCEEPALFTLSTGGNLNLNEERSQSLHFGFGYNFAQTFGLDLNIFAIKIFDEIRYPDVGQILLLESQGLSVEGVSIIRDQDNASDPNAILSIETSFLNVSNGYARDRSKMVSFFSYKLWNLPLG